MVQEVVEDLTEALETVLEVVEAFVAAAVGLTLRHSRSGVVGGLRKGGVCDGGAACALQV